ncbi:MAG: response regulator [Bryobacteraceae bacterium]
MSRILLADDSPHAQRMGERILREEGFEVVTVTDGETAVIRLADVDPDLVLADVFLPRKNGFDICEFVKKHPRHQHVRVVLTAGLLEPLDEAEARRVQADGILKKPFEASMVVDTIRPLMEAAQSARNAPAEATAQPEEAPGVAPAAAEAAMTVAVASPAPDPIDPERVRAAVTVALDAALPKMIDEITERVLVALGQ